MKFALLALLIVAVIGFFVIVWKAAKDWRWYQIVAAIFTMIFAVGFMFPVAGVLKSRAAWHQVYEELAARHEKSQSDQKLIKNGDPDDPAGGVGVIELGMQLTKLGSEAGRRWRNLQLQNVAGDNVTLIQAANPIATDIPVDGGEPADADAAATLPLVPEGLVVYGFAEQPQPDVNVPVPTFYLGEFRVTAATPNQVTLVPTGKLEPNQQQAIANRQAASWSLLEMLPLDGHEPFVAEGSEPDNEYIFGRPNEELINRILGNRVDPATLSSYLRDGTRATPDDPPMTRWVKIEFTKAYSIEVDSKDQRGALDGGFFDGAGRAVDSRLQTEYENGAIPFKAGEQITVSELAANELFDQGVARLVDTYFVRPLNDYRYVLRRIRLRLTELAIRQEELKFEAKVLQEAVDATSAMKTVNEEIKRDLELDLDQSVVERESIRKYNEQLKQQVDETRATLVRLYNSNQALEKELDRIHFSIQRSVDSVTLAN